MALNPKKVLALANEYTNETVAGGGAIKGKNCIIESITSIIGGQRVTFKWTLDDGTVQTDTMDVMNGADGKGIKSVAIDANEHLIITYTDDTTTDAGKIEVSSAVDSVNGKTGNVTLTASDVGALPDDTPIPSKTSDLTNDSDFAVDANYVHTDNNYDATAKAIVDGVTDALTGKVDKVSGKGLSTEDYTSEEKTKLADVEAGAEVNAIESITLNGTEVTPDANKNVALTVITKAVNDLVNYYLKSETYSKTEVDSIVTAIKNGRFEVVATLPTTDIKTNVIYLVPKDPTQTSNVKDEYINLDGTTAGWEKIGDTEIDLSDYVTTQALNTALADYTTTADLTTLLAAKADKSTVDGILDGTNIDSFADVETALADYQTKDLTTPIEGETTVEGALGALSENKQDSLTFDNAPTENSNNPVKSGGVYTAIDDAVKALDVSDTAVAGSYVTEVSETDGKISVVREAADATPTENSNKLVKSGGVYSADANIYAEMTRQGVKNILSQQFDEVMITASLGNKATSANGLTLTYNSDGSIKINGTPTDSSKNVAIRFDWDTNNHPFDISYLAGKKIVASISETEINGIKIIPGYFDASDGAHQYSGADITTKGEYTYPNDAKWARCYMSISGAYSYSDVTVYPMIYIPFEGATDDYAPPTKTNQKLTAENEALTNQANDMVNVLGAKNLLPYNLASIIANNTNGTWSGNNCTKNGVTFTVNDDGSITVNGTATANTFLDICTKNAFTNSIFTANLSLSGVSEKTVGGYTLSMGIVSSDAYIGYTKSNNTVWLNVGNGKTVSNLTVYPMLRLASITDNTYQPYAPTNKMLNDSKVDWKSNGVLGAKNLYPLDFNTIKDGHSSSVYEWNDRTVTTSNVAFTINEDGTVTVNTVGTVPSNISFSLGTYPIGDITDGCIASDGGVGVSGQYKLVLVFKSGSTYLGEVSVYDEEIITLPSGCDRVDFTLVVYANTTVSNITFKPMIRLAADTDDTYRRYVPSNASLDKSKVDWKSNGVLGVKNLLPNEATNSGYNGVEFVVNSDGTVNVTGPATSGNSARLKLSSIYLKRGRYILSAGVVIGAGNYIGVIIGAETGAYAYTTTNGEVEFEVNDESTSYNFFIRISDNASGTYKFYPMLRLATDSDDTYQPYVPTNKVLNESKVDWKSNGILGAKNLLPLEPSTFTIGATVNVVVDNGIITLNGTRDSSSNTIGIVQDISLPVGTYILSDDTESERCRFQIYNVTTNTVYWYANPIIIYNGTDELQCRIWIMGNSSFNNTKLYPMIRLAEDTDKTFQPYVPTNRELLSYKANGILGAKNLYPIDLASLKALNSSYSWNSNKATKNGLEFTINDDNTISCTGTASALTTFVLPNYGTPHNSVVISGCPKEGGASSCEIQVGLSTNDVARDRGAGATIVVGESTTFIHVIIREGFVADNIVFKPMIRLASDTDPTYQPYAKTNKELTDDVAVISDELILTGFASITTNSAVRQGNIIKLYVNATVGNTDIAAWDTNAITIPSTILPNASSHNISSIVNGYEVGANNNNTPLNTYASLGINKKIGIGVTLTAGKRYIFETVLFLV